MNLDALKPTQYLLVDGTSEPQSYVAFARKGNVILSFRPNAIASGAAVGVPSTTYVGVRLRAAFEPKVIKDALNIAVPSPVFERPGETLPEMTWETDTDRHAASQVSIFLQGSLREAPADVIAQFENGEVAAKLAEYLVKLVQGDELLLTKEQIATYIQETFEPPISKLKDKLALHQKVIEATASTVGTVGVQAKLLKDLLSKVQKSDATKAPKPPKADKPFDDGPVEDL